MDLFHLDNASIVAYKEETFEIEWAGGQVPPPFDRVKCIEARRRAIEQVHVVKRVVSQT